VLQVASIAVDDRIEVGPARTLFNLGDLSLGELFVDDARFIGVRVPRVDPPTEIVVVQNWQEELARIVPPVKSKVGVKPDTTACRPLRRYNFSRTPCNGRPPRASRLVRRTRCPQPARKSTS
jgi:hypothetical protein